ncbi:hypothetical protein K469DRAFT_662308 [Zopfia rhizophila CBS 207.26]|uniref:5'-3' DNA helicase ZGRF1-like N-terminal domain-containing protein n=1 Tax=Zopfia rhizophila CBS 207.26 TaxID=1314779 RepID=A0A6A6E5Z4_9PEZI|nr:hypothetical protein K469DRAFT_662308 [Zopfia rhizophila CBS 207.26]
MAALGRSTPRLSAIPASQNTAPVAEFRCLFTHDIRRKQKRWQDGYLRFHTFNNRVMVYDTTRNFLGDTYWKESNEVQEGDELTLDKGVMVEVADAVGVTKTDLTPLFERKPKDSSPGKNTAPPPRPVPRASVPPTNNVRNSSQLRHKSLNALLGAPKGPIGKAGPIKSPFEARREKENECEAGRATKRQKTDHGSSALRSSSPMSNGEKALPLWARTADAKTASVQKSARSIPPESEIINLDSETDHILSDVTLPKTPPGYEKVKKRNISRAKGKQDLAKETSVQTTPNLPRGKIPLPRSKPKETPKRPLRSPSPPVSASNRICNVDFAIESAKKPVKKPSPPASPPRDPRAKALRLSSGNRREPMQKSNEKDTFNASGYEPVPFPYDEDEPLAQRQTSKSDQTINGQKDNNKPNPTKETVSVWRKAKHQNSSPQFPDECLDGMAAVHGRMDHCLLPGASNPPSKSKKSKSPSAFKVTKSKPAATKTALGAPEMIGNTSVSNNEHPKNPTTDQQKPTSTSLNKITLSTGDFPKKKKLTPKTSESIDPVTNTDTPGRSTVTKKPSSLLQKPSKANTTVDEIEDSTQPANNSSPNRTFRRVRSANDAYIPSQSEQWEKRNLPNAQPTNKPTSKSGLSELTKRTDPRRKFQRSTSLNLNMELGSGRGGNGEVEVEVSPVVDTDIGPWSTEAFDLFDWRPPAKDEDEGIGMLVDV